MKTKEIYWVRMPGSLDHPFESMKEARLYIERGAGNIGGRFEVVEQGIRVNGLYIPLYVGDENCNFLRLLCEKELRFLDRKQKYLENIGKTKMTRDDLIEQMRKFQRSIAGHQKIKNIDFGFYITLLLTVMLESNGFSKDTKMYADRMEMLKRVLSMN